MTFYGILSDGEDQVFINDCHSSSLILNSYIYEIKTEPGDMHLLLSLATYKMCRLNNFCLALLELFRQPLTTAEAYMVLQEKKIQLNHKAFETFLDKCVRSDILHVLA